MLGVAADEYFVIVHEVPELTHLWELAALNFAQKHLSTCSVSQIKL